MIIKYNDFVNENVFDKLKNKILGKPIPKRFENFIFKIKNLYHFKSDDYPLIKYNHKYGTVKIYLKDWFEFNIKLNNDDGGEFCIVKYKSIYKPYSFYKKDDSLIKDMIDCIIHINDSGYIMNKHSQQFSTYLLELVELLNDEGIESKIKKEFDENDIHIFNLKLISFIKKYNKKQ